MKSEPTKCCLLTGVGRAAIAVVAIEGPDALRCLMKSFRPARDRPFSDGQVRYGTWVGHDRGESDPSSPDASESVVVVPFSSTEDTDKAVFTRFEIHCHGGVAAAERLLSDLDLHGVLRGQASDAFDSDPHFGSKDPFIRQAVDVMLRCATQRTAAIAMQQVNGAMVRWRDASRQKLSLCRRAGGIGPDPNAQAPDKPLLDQAHSGTQPANIEKNISQVANEATEILRWADLGRHLAVPWNIVLAGPPNVGKSSLINSIVGFDRSITMDLPGTTRDVLDVETVVDGWPLRFRDTAGLRETAVSKGGHHAIEREGISRAKVAMEDADLVVLVTEPGTQTLDLTPESNVPVVHVRNKADLVDDASSTAAAEGNFYVDTVATTGQGVNVLLQQILARLVGDLLKPDQPIPLCESQVNWLERIVAAEHDFDQMCHLFEDDD